MSYGAHPGSPSSGAPATSAGAAHGESFTARAARIPGGRLKQVDLPGWFSCLCLSFFSEGVSLFFSLIWFDDVLFFTSVKPRFPEKSPVELTYFWLASKMPWNLGVNSAQAFGETMDTGCPYVAVGMPKRFLFDLFVGFFKKEGFFKYLFIYAFIAFSSLGMTRIPRSDLVSHTCCLWRRWL